MLQEPDVPEIDVDELERRTSQLATIVDVREPHEYREAHIPGARLIPLGVIADNVHQLPDDRPVYMVCAVGGRSLAAAAWLRERGIDAVNVAGGTKAWLAAGKAYALGDAP